ncbi:sulfatase-like hydrolase/transferase [Pelagicoccus mobilis]|uniref:Sulfatase-like hydrolase/transferase n=1 Tax=Pelagicoccus mobilis TaxID=415221 RepID=A0A934S1A4_9BACT|nr:sulfatase-like hydrolase/transferase [Pelagicoccus mobilis]
MAQQTQPNIILIYVDDMGVGDASYTGGTVQATPNIDRMAAGGRVYEQFYTASPVCSPSRVAVTTGMYPLRWDINTFLSSRKHNRLCDQSDYLSTEAPTIAKTLQTVGYKTGHFGKWHMGGGRDVEAPSIGEYGFDEYVSTWESPNPDPALTSTNWIWGPDDTVKRWDRTSYFVDRTLAFLKKNKGTPCYVNLWPDDPHSPWVSGPAELDDKKKGYFDLANLKPVLEDLDVQIGRLLHGLRVLGLEANTLVLFTSDNGPAPSFERIRTNGLRGVKNSLYEGGISMPFIAYWPGRIAAGGVDTDSIVSAIDLFPTLSRLGGAELPPEVRFDGEDFGKSLLSGETHKRQEKLFWEYGRRNPRFSIPKLEDERSPVLAVRDGDWKCFSSFDGTELELYNLSTDPNETTNLAKENRELAERLQKEMLNWFEQNNESEI